MNKLYLAWGLKERMRGVFDENQVKEIWTATKHLHSFPDFLWINREPTGEELLRLYNSCEKI